MVQSYNEEELLYMDNEINRIGEEGEEKGPKILWRSGDQIRGKKWIGKIKRKGEIG